MTSQALYRYRVLPGVDVKSRVIFFGNAICIGEVPRRLRGSG